MTDEKKAIEQALEAAAAELKAGGNAPLQEPAAQAEASEAVPEAAEASSVPETPEAEPKSEPKKKTEPKKAAKPKSGKKGAAALKELAKVRRNKIIGITAAVIAVMLGVFFIARGAANRPNDHGGAPTISEDGTKVYPDGTTEYTDGTVVDPDGTITAPDGTVTSPDGTITAPDGTVIQPGGTVNPVDNGPGDTNVTNVDADNGGTGGAADTPWSTMTDGDYQIAIRRLNGYTGNFFEDGSEEPVTNVLALQFRNDSEQDIQYAEYVFEVNGEEIPFKLSNLPVGQRCVVLAANRHAFDANEVLKLKSRLVAAVDSLPSADSQILAVVNGDAITIMNLTDQPIPVARVFYKTYYADQETFVGGITYTVTVQNIPAGGSSGAITPEHFSGEMSRFVGSGVYDS